MRQKGQHEKPNKPYRISVRVDANDLPWIRKILMDIGGVKVNVTKGATQEIYRPNSQEKEIESKGIEKVAFEEQLRHLKVLMKLIIKGASNAMFVAGRGGTREDADCGR